MEKVPRACADSGFSSDRINLSPFTKGLRWTRDHIRQWIQAVGRKLGSRMWYPGHGGKQLKLQCVICLAPVSPKAEYKRDTPHISFSKEAIKPKRKTL